MTNEERDIITRFIERVGGGGGSVPTTALPPVDPQADALITDLLHRNPAATYRMVQTAFVQEHALVEAQSRIGQLQAQLDAARAQPAPQPQSHGFLSGLFGGGAQPQPQYAPPPPQYASGYQPGMFQRSGGSGFLGSALTTAAGVAGGMVAGNALMNLFEGHHGGGFGGGGEPWGGGGVPDAQASGSAWDNATESSNAAGWDQQAAPDSGGAWDQGGGDGGGAWDQGGGGGDDGGGGGF